jgi:DNA-directed RNA polymerase subunit beta'
VQFVDIEVGETVREEDAGKGQKALVVIEHKGDLHPQINIVDGDGNILDFHYLPAKARLEVADGEEIEAGHMLARQPRAASGSQDIVGGLPRVTEIFEARKPKDPAIMAEISGRVELHSDKRKGKMTDPRRLRLGHREGPPRPDRQAAARARGRLRPGGRPR